MKFKVHICLLITILLALLSSCTLSPWHRDQAEAYKKKGMALIEAKQYLGAIKELLEADNYAPNDPETNYYLGIALDGRGLKEPAMERVQKAVDLKSDYSEAQNYLGVLYMNKGEWEKAIACFDKALKNYLYSTPALPLYNSGWAYYNLNNFDMALSRYREALAQDRMGVLHAQIEKNMGLIYIKKNDLVSAKKHFQKSVSLDATLVDAHFFLGECNWKIRDFENARKSFQQVMQLAPQSPYAQKASEYLQSRD